MKEKVINNNININNEKEDKFKALSKKRKNEKYPFEIYKTQKKIIFYLQKIVPETNNNNHNNENIINKTNINNNNINININNTNDKREIINNINNANQNKIQNSNQNLNIKSENEPKNINNIDAVKIKPKTKEYGDYICYIEKQIGSGSFGQVLYGINKKTSMEVAIKIIDQDTPQDNIKNEIYFSKHLEKNPGFPSIYYTYFEKKKYIIVQSLLGPSLDKLFRYCDKKFPIKTVLKIGIEMVKRLETMHKEGVLHRDLKPSNFTWGNYSSKLNNNEINSNILNIKTIYLIDFGLSCSYIDKDIHYKMKTHLNFVGTLRYASVNSHKGISQSRRDDLESMLYILIYFLKGKLPWQDAKAKKKEERHKLIFEIKSKMNIESLCQGLPSEFVELLKYTKKMEFDENPDYNKFYIAFNDLINKLNNEIIEEKNYNYIWERVLVDNIKKYNENHDDNIKQGIENFIFKGLPININNFIDFIIMNNNKEQK